VLLDCDPGHDDALAITLALARPELEVLGITTVAGNVGLRETTRNALRVLALLGRPDVPVAAGAGAPLMRSLEIADDVHGESGLDGADLPEPRSEVRPEGALAFLRAALEAAPRPVTLIPTGPLTNIAQLLLAAQGLAPKIAHVCLMGGAVREGNWTPAAEFNIWVDPEAARIVFRSGLPITMVGLDVTHQALFRAADLERLEAVGTPASRVFADLLRFYARFHRERYGWDGSPIHDAVAVAHVAVPGLVRVEPYRVDVETTGELTRGRTVVDTRGVPGPEPNADVALALDRDRFADLLVEAVASFG
jgi:pyrimidine-specific ribonucleoside hydrolase